MPITSDLVGIHEIAALAQVTRTRAWQITRNKGFPAPRAELAMGRVWDREPVVRYLAGRTTGPPTKERSDDGVRD